MKINIISDEYRGKNFKIIPLLNGKCLSIVIDVDYKGSRVCQKEDELNGVDQEVARSHALNFIDGLLSGNKVLWAHNQEDDTTH